MERSFDNSATLFSALHEFYAIMLDEIGYLQTVCNIVVYTLLSVSLAILCFVSWIILYNVSTVFPTCQHCLVGAKMAHALPVSIIQKICNFYQQNEMRFDVIENAAEILLGDEDENLNVGVTEEVDNESVSAKRANSSLDAYIPSTRNDSEAVVASETRIPAVLKNDGNQILIADETKFEFVKRLRSHSNNEITHPSHGDSESSNYSSLAKLEETIFDQTKKNYSLLAVSENCKSECKALPVDRSARSELDNIQINTYAPHDCRSSQWEHISKEVENHGEHMPSTLPRFELLSQVRPSRGTSPVLVPESPRHHSNSADRPRSSQAIPGLIGQPDLVQAVDSHPSLSASRRPALDVVDTHKSAHQIMNHPNLENFVVREVKDSFGALLRRRSKNSLAWYLRAAVHRMALTLVVGLCICLWLVPVRNYPYYINTANLIRGVRRTGADFLQAVFTTRELIIADGFSRSNTSALFAATIQHRNDMQADMEAFRTGGYIAQESNTIRFGADQLGILEYNAIMYQVHPN